MKQSCPYCHSDHTHWKHASHSLADGTLIYRCAVCRREFAVQRQNETDPMAVDSGRAPEDS